MNRIISITLILVIGRIFTHCQSSEPMNWTTTSPDGSLTITLLQTPDAQLQYFVSRITNGEPDSVIRLSPLGLEISDHELTNLQADGKAEKKSINNIVARIHGKQNLSHDECNEQKIRFTNANGNTLFITLRAYNDGVAFRYGIESEKQTAYTVKKEFTGFSVPAGKAWLQPYDKITMWTPAYEKPFQNGIPVGTTSPHEEGWCFPALFETEKHWILITESDLDANYAGSHLQPDAPGGLYTLRFP